LKSRLSIALSNELLYKYDPGPVITSFLRSDALLEDPNPNDGALFAKLSKLKFGRYSE
jgi:hypothetical protein